MAEPELPPLYYASVANDLAEVERLLRAGADPNDGESVFHAAEKNHRAVIDLLIQHGCEISSAHAVYGNTPLFFLCGYGDDEEGRAAWHQGIACLLERGADPNVTSTARRETPLHKIADSPVSLATARLLLDHGADPLARDAEGATAYQLAMRSGNTRLMELLTERGGAVPLTDQDEFLAACRKGDEPRARQYLQKNPSLKDDLAKEIDFAGTMLHWAAWKGDIGAVRTLIALGADVNQRDREFGSSPLGWAGHGSCNCRSADDDYCAVVTLLRESGATQEASINRFNETPEGMATPRVAECLTARSEVEILKLLDSFADAWNRHDLDALMSMMTDDCVFEASAGPQVDGQRSEGMQTVRAAYAAVFETFHDAHWANCRHFVSGNRGVSEWTFTGTHTDGSRVEVTGCDLFTFRGGKIAIKNSYRKNRSISANDRTPPPVYFPR